MDALIFYQIDNLYLIYLIYLFKEFYAYIIYQYILY